MDIAPHKLIPIGLAALGAAAVSWLIFYSPSDGISARVPGQDIRPGYVEPSTPVVDLTGEFIKGKGSPGKHLGAWPHFRGPDRDGINKEFVPLADKWPADGPKRLWSVDMGEGYAGAAVLNGRVYVIDYDQNRGGDALRCLSLDDGEEIWRRWYKIRITVSHGISRTVPAVTDKYVVSLGPKCHLVCLDAVTGDYVWGKDLVREYGTKVPAWYAGQCPIIDGDRVIIAPVGEGKNKGEGPKVLMTALDLATGETIWTSLTPKGWKMSHATITVWQPPALGGKKMYVYCASDGNTSGAVGVSAETGEILWRIDPLKLKFPVVSLVPSGTERLFWAAGYGAGSVMIQIAESGGKFSASRLFSLPEEVFGAEQQSPIFFGGYLYGLRMDGQLVCLNPDGAVVWTSGAANKYGSGPFAIADGKIFVLDDHGMLTMVKATPEGFSPLAKAKVLDGPEAWGPMAIVSGRMIIRDLNRMICIDVEAK